MKMGQCGNQMGTKFWEVVCNERDAPCRINFSSQTPTNHADWFLYPRGLGLGKPTPARKSSLDHEISAPSIAPCLSGVRARLIGGDFFEKNRENKKLDRRPR